MTEAFKPAWLGRKDLSADAMSVQRHLAFRVLSWSFRDGGAKFFIRNRILYSVEEELYRAEKEEQ